MKRLITIALILLTQIVFGQIKTIKVQGAGGGGVTDTALISQIIHDSLTTVSRNDSTIIYTKYPLQVIDSPYIVGPDTLHKYTIEFRSDSVPQLTYANGVDTAAMGSNPNNVPSIKWLLPRLGGSSGSDPLKLNISDTAAMLSPYAHNSNTVTVNGSTQTLGSNPSFTVSSISQATISDTLKSYASSGSLTTDNVVFSTPIALAVTNHFMSGTFALKSQSAYTVLGRGSGSGSPSFLASIDSNWIPSLHSKLYYDGIYRNYQDDTAFVKIMSSFGAKNFKGLFLGNTVVSGGSLMNTSPSIVFSNKNSSTLSYTRLFSSGISGQSIMYLQYSTDSITWYTTMSIYPSRAGGVSSLNLYYNSGSNIGANITGDGSYYGNGFLGNGSGTTYNSTNGASIAYSANHKFLGTSLPTSGTGPIIFMKIEGTQSWYPSVTAGSYETMRIASVEGTIPAGTNYLLRVGLGAGVSFASKLDVTSTGQLGLGNSTPAASSLADLTSTTQGFLPPRMTTTQRDAITSPAEGLIIYNLTTHKLNVFTTAWEAVTSL